jgi:hypothetical protein
MTSCPRCHQPIDTQALQCPYCRTPLKAYGHPGIPLYQSIGQDFLCDRCIYHEDDSCNYPQRPYAKTCTLFHDKSKPLVEETKSFRDRPGLSISSLTTWCRRNQGLLLLIVLIIISVAIAF